MKEYLKMPIGFEGGAEWFGEDIKKYTTASDVLIDAAVHAIDSHDELVAEVDRLKKMVEAMSLDMPNKPIFQA